MCSSRACWGGAEAQAALRRRDAPSQSRQCASLAGATAPTCVRRTRFHRDLRCNPSHIRNYGAPVLKFHAGQGVPALFVSSCSPATSQPAHPHANRNRRPPVPANPPCFRPLQRRTLDPSALARTEAHHAVVKVPDRRLAALSELFSPKSTVSAPSKFVDVVGLKKGSPARRSSPPISLPAVKTNDRAWSQVVRGVRERLRSRTRRAPWMSARDIADVSRPSSSCPDMAILETRIERLKKQGPEGGR